MTPYLQSLGLILRGWTNYFDNISINSNGDHDNTIAYVTRGVDDRLMEFYEKCGVIGLDYRFGSKGESYGGLQVPGRILPVRV